MKKKRPVENADAPDLDAWADALATMAPNAVDEMRTVAKRLANNTRLSSADREFAKSQLAAIQRATRRKRQPARKRKQIIE